MCRIHVARSCSVPTLAAACLCGLLGALPSSAAASVATTLTSESGHEQLVFTATPGELNDVSIIREQSGLWRIADRTSPVEPGGQCAPVDANEVMCPPVVWLRVALGDGDDHLVVTGGGGIPGRTLILGEAGRDFIELEANRGRSATPGEAGTDFFLRGRFRGPYSVDAGADDDRVTGSAADDVLDGGPGVDQLAGGGGDDLVSGGQGEDDLQGGDGGDLMVGGTLAALQFGRSRPDGFDTLRGDEGDDLLVGGRGPDRLQGGSGNDALFYDRPRGPLSVTFNGRADDGPPGEQDDVGVGDVEGAVMSQSGRLALNGDLGFEGGGYTLAGGSATRASVVLLSSTGTGGDSIEGQFSGTTFAVRLINPGGSLGRIEARGGSRRRCRRAASPSVFSPPQAQASYLSLRRVLARILARRRGRSAAAAGLERQFQVVGRASSATASEPATWVTTDTCRGTLTEVKTGDVMVKEVVQDGLSRRTVRRLRGTAEGRFRTRGRNSSAFVRG